MKKVVWFTPAILPINGGQQMYSIGNIKKINEIAQLKVVTRIDDNVEITEESQKELAGLDITYLKHYDKKTVLNKFDHPVRKYFSIKCGTVPVYKNVYCGLCHVIDEFIPDIIVIDYVGYYNYYRKLRKKYPQVKFIYHSHNAEFVNFRQMRQSNNPIVQLINNLYIKKRTTFENILLRDCEASSCISRYDIDILNDKFSDCGRMVYAKPMISFERVKSEKDVEKFNKNLIVVGSMDWHPNIRGIIWFVDEVFAKLLEIDPEYKLYLVGRNPKDEIVELASKYPDNVIVTGSVPSTTPYYSMGDISIVPVFEGTGAKIKVLESIGKRIPTICADFASKDYDITDDEIIVVKQDAKEYLDAIFELANNKELRMEKVRKMDNYYDNYFVINPEFAELFS